MNESLVLLNESMYKCVFIDSIKKRHVYRNISNKYVFYKSLNIVTKNAGFEFNAELLCKLTLHFLQFKIHLNLISDYEIDLFYEKCSNLLIRQENGYMRNFMKCSNGWNQSISNEYSSEIIIEKREQGMFKNLFFLIVMICILIILIFPLGHFILKNRTNEQNIKGLIYM